MRFVPMFLAIALLAGCACPTSEPRMIVKSPLWFDSVPTLTPQQYAIPVQAPQQYVQVQRVSAPQAATYCAPAPAPQYAPLVIPQSAGPCPEPVSSICEAPAWQHTVAATDR